MAPGDLVLVSELSRLGRSIGQIIALLDALAKRSVRFRAVKENFRIDGAQDMPTKVIIALFALFAEFEKDLVSERTKEGLAKTRVSGKLLGCPKGSLGQSKLDGREAAIKKLSDEGRFEDVGRANRRMLAAHAGPIYSFAEANGEKLDAQEL